MKVQELVQAIRDHYFNGFVKAIEALESSNDRFASEVLIQLNSDERDFPYSLWRVDMLTGPKESPKVTEFNHDKYLNFEPVPFSFGELSVRLFPCYWNGIEYRVTGPLPRPGSEFHGWFYRWLDPTDSRYDETSRFSGLVHTVLPPTPTADGWETSVDFGTSQPEAFFALLYAISAIPASHVDIGSFSMISDIP